MPPRPSARTPLVATAIGFVAGGLVFGLASVLAELYTPTGLTFEAGAPIRAADVNARFAALETALQKLDDEAVLTRLSTIEQEHNALEEHVHTPPDCPRGYTRKLDDPNLPSGATLCVRGADEVVKVGDFWVDRHEGLIVDAAFYNGGLCNGDGVRYGSPSSDSAAIDYPEQYPDNGNYQVPLYACSIKNYIPSGSMSWFQAQQACTAAGKHLITNEEWQAATAGTVDPGASAGGGGTCKTTGTRRASGEGTLCQSNYGAMDMIGNVREAVAHIGAWGWRTEPTNNGNSGTRRSYWDDAFGSDVVFNLIGDRYVLGTSGKVFEKGLPSVLYRGGTVSASWHDQGEGAGNFAMVAVSPKGNVASGFRCALRQ